MEKLLRYCYSQGHTTANKEKLNIKSIGNTFSRIITQTIPNSVESILEKNLQVELSFPGSHHLSSKSNSTEIVGDFISKQSRGEFLGFSQLGMFETECCLNNN